MVFPFAIKWTDGQLLPKHITMSDSTGLHYVKLEHSASNIKAMEPNSAWSDTMYTFNANLSYFGYKHTLL